MQTAPSQTVPLRVHYVLARVLYVFAQGWKPDTALLRKVPESASWSCNGLAPPQLHRERCHWLANSRVCRRPWEFPAGHQDVFQLVSEGGLWLPPDFPAQPSSPQNPVYVVVGWCSPWPSSWPPKPTQALKLVTSFLVFYWKCLLYWK